MAYRCPTCNNWTSCWTPGLSIAEMSFGKIEDELFNFLKHGSEEHQVWLKKSIDAFFKGNPRPDLK